MTDNFALLEQPRRPWIDPDLLKEKFLSLSTECHPDRVFGLGPAERAFAQERYTRLNAAYQCLRSTKDRLRHLLELENGPVARETNAIPADLMELSIEVGAACREADRLIKERPTTTSPLLQVQYFERGLEQTDRLLALQRRVNERSAAVDERLGKLDAGWSDPRDRQSKMEELELVYRLTGFYTRWAGQIQERIASLAV